MRIGYLTTDDPLYLPAFFHAVLTRRPTDAADVFVVPPLYRNQTSIQAAVRYWRTFGNAATFRLAARVAAAGVRRQSISSVCRRLRVPCRDVPDVNDPTFLGHLKHIEVELLVSVSCPQVFRKPLIDLPPRGILNIHGAILPHYRGVMPSFWMLANGEKTAGVSIYYVNEAIDAGDLCGQRQFAISMDESLDNFIRRSKAIAGELLVELLAGLDHGELPRTPLDLSKGSYYSWPDAAAVKRFRDRGCRVW
jgi:methionyl-tRNA formyltransferase